MTDDLPHRGRVIRRKSAASGKRARFGEIANRNAWHWRIDGHQASRRVAQVDLLRKPARVGIRRSLPKQRLDDGGFYAFAGGKFIERKDAVSGRPGSDLYQVDLPIMAQPILG